MAGTTLPPLSSLLAFEAVARRLSFSRAAEELHVTPGAVSQQVRALEQRMGEPLFHRTRRSVALTAAALRMLPDVQAGFQLLVRATDGKKSAGAARSLTISVAPSFASKWLLPRLPEFSEAHPEVDLRISATVSLADFGEDGCDLAIRFGRGDYPGVQSEKLFAESLAPMCAPKLVCGKRPLRKPSDLRRFRLLHDTSIPGEAARDGWKKWLELAGAEGLLPQSEMRFSLAELALQAAIDGAGVVLGRLTLAEADLAAGRLVRPFAPTMPLDVSYFLVMPARNRERAEIQAFRDWLLGAVKASLPPSRRTSRARKSGA